MTTATASKPRAPRKPRPSRREQKAAAYLAENAAWLRLRDPQRPTRCAGYGLPSESQPGLYHLTDGKVCGCTWGRERMPEGAVPCSHALAAQQYIAAKRAATTTQPGASAPTLAPIPAAVSTAAVPPAIDPDCLVNRGDGTWLDVASGRTVADTDVAALVAQQQPPARFCPECGAELEPDEGECIICWAERQFGAVEVA